VSVKVSGAEQVVANIRLAGQSADIGTVFEMLQRVASNAGRVGMTKASPLQIKVVRTANGARIRLKGPQAMKYKQMVLQQVEAKKADLAKQIKDDIITRSKP
jgi:hypothetical protein